MSGQADSKGGRNQYASMQNSVGSMFGSTPYDSGYFSMGNSRRMPFGMGVPSNANPLARDPTQAANNNPFGRPAGPAGDMSSGNNLLSRGSFSGFGNIAPLPDAGVQPNPFGRYASDPGSQYQPSAPGNVDPNSPDYAAYYYGLAPSTRAYMAAPGSGMANYLYGRSQGGSGEAHF